MCEFVQKFVRVLSRLNLPADKLSWAHGMGNLEGNSLPQCQLERIVKLLRPLPWTPISSADEEQEDDRCWKVPRLSIGSELDLEELNSQPLYFWIDTICVPLKPKTIKTKALGGMRICYGRANRVLVIDTDLMSTQLEPQLNASDRRDVMNVCILASNWQQRLWTLQEAVMAKKLWFQFASGAFEKISKYKRFLGDAQDHYEAYYNNELGYYSGEISYEEWHVNLLDTYRVQLRKLNLVWRTLRARKTSDSADIPVVVAILLDADLPELLSVSDGDRTRKLWSMLPVIPAGILCFPCRKLKNDNFRWAAASMDDCASFCLPVGHPAFVSPNGSVGVELFGFMIDLDRIAQAVIPIMVNGKIAYIRQNLRNGNLPWNTEDGTIFPQTPARIGFIIGEEPSESPTKVALEGCLAAMVSIIDCEPPPYHKSKSEDSESTLVVNFLRVVSIFGQGSWYDLYGIQPWTEEELEEKEIEPIATTFLKADQSWSIVPHSWKSSA